MMARGSPINQHILDSTGVICAQEPSIWLREWEVITDPTLVQVACGYRGLYHHFAGQLVAERV